MRAYPYIGVPDDPTTTAFLPDDVRVYLGYPSGDTVSLSDQEANDLMFRSQEAFERCTGLTLFDTTFTNLRDCFHEGHSTHHHNFNLELRRAPTQSITSIKRQVDEVLTLIAATVFKLIRANQLFFGSAVLKESQTWPTDFDIEQEVIEIIFKAGFGATGASLPADLKNGLLRIIADLHSNKGDCPEEEQISPGAMALIRKFRVLEI